MPNRYASRLFRGAIFHMRSASAWEFFEDGGLVIDATGKIKACADWREIERDYPLAGYEFTRLKPHELLMPGLIDLHVHLPQLPAIGYPADNLLEWLSNYIFPAEAKFADPAYARRVSEVFFQQLLANGTTTAAVFLTSHPEATNVAFEVAERTGNRVVMGQNLMDVNAPAELLRDTEAQLRETEALYRQWHGRDEGRLLYAWMPRFAITSSEPLLAGIGALRKKYPDAYLHTHISEQPTEIQAVLHQFPWAESYTQVYDRFGLLAPRTILAHGVHLGEGERQRIRSCECGIAHCPTSNFFLKSGRFPWFDMMREGLRLGFGSDVGAGPELWLGDVLKAAQSMQLDRLIPVFELFYAATLGGAHALCLEDRLGNFEPGKEADFIVMDTRFQPELVDEARLGIEERLSRMMYLARPHHVVQTWVHGRLLHDRTGKVLIPSDG